MLVIFSKMLITEQIHIFKKNHITISRLCFETNTSNNRIFSNRIIHFNSQLTFWANLFLNLALLMFLSFNFISIQHVYRSSFLRIIFSLNTYVVALKYVIDCSKCSSRWWFWEMFLLRIQDPKIRVFSRAVFELVACILLI